MPQLLMCTSHKSIPRGLEQEPFVEHESFDFTWLWRPFFILTRQRDTSYYHRKRDIRTCCSEGYCA
uniref:Uncharacterized protein n=1 Tax=Aegilops tauschii subsp. strangulata TaxID=200361 RepID=A0A453KUX8_AEGTS